jgi:hypothetical protein
VQLAVCALHVDGRVVVNRAGSQQGAGAKWHPRRGLGTRRRSGHYGVADPAERAELVLGHREGPPAGEDVVGPPEAHYRPVWVARLGVWELGRGRGCRSGRGVVVVVPTASGGTTTGDVVVVVGGVVVGGVVVGGAVVGGAVVTPGAPTVTVPAT